MNATEEKLLKDMQDRISAIQSSIASLQSEAAELSALMSVLRSHVSETTSPKNENAVDSVASCPDIRPAVSPQEEFVAGNEDGETGESIAVADDVREKNDADVPDKAGNPADTVAIRQVSPQESLEKTPNLARQTDARKLTDLRKAIGLNDRFRFRHDLFGNDDNLMMDTICKLNAMESFDDALAYLRANFKWDEDNPTVTYLLDILHRRFY